MIVNIFTIVIELTTTHPTKDAKLTVDMITQGRYRPAFWIGVVLVGNLIPVIIILLGTGQLAYSGIASLLVLLGIYLTEHIWVEAPQRISLS